LGGVAKLHAKFLKISYIKIRFGLAIIEKENVEL